MTEAAVDFLLEKMTQLLCWGNKLILFDSHQIQSIFQDLNFLQKFLKEHENVKDVAAKIREVTHEVDDLIDLVILRAERGTETTSRDYEHGRFFSFAGNMAAITGFTKEMESIKAVVKKTCGKRLSLPRSSAQTIHDRFVRAIQHTESIKTEVEIYEKGMSLVLCHSHTVHDFLFNWFEKTLNLARKFVRAFDGFVIEIEFIKSFVTLHGWKEENEGEKGEGEQEFVPSQMMTQLMTECPLNMSFLSGIELQSVDDDDELSRKMMSHAKMICDDVTWFMKEIELVKCKFMVIHETLLTAQVPGFEVPPKILKALSKMVVNAGHIRERFQRFAREIESIKKGTMMVCQKGWNPSWLELYMGERIFLGFGWVMVEIKAIKAEVAAIYMKKVVFDLNSPEIQKSWDGASLRPTRQVAEEETMVGFEDQKAAIIDLLAEEHGKKAKKLKLIQIVGMPGLGKTTLAMKVYTDPLITHHFYILAWVYASQIYQKRNMLLHILRSVFNRGDEICEMSDDKLGQELYKRLKGNRYLIVIDDIWNVGVWDDLKRYFPNDNNGSRIIFTSRSVVIDGAKSHCLRFLNEEDSWILLQHKAFENGSCPPELVEIGKQIANKCGGLPLAIVVVSGLLAKSEKTQNWWRRVAQSVSSYIATDRKQYMDTLALSYSHLPCHLKPCFLYFGAFSEDYEIPVWKLIWLWIAEGFIQRKQYRSLEDVAEDYLMNLVDRNLVIVSKKRSNGEVKACRMHDLLRDLCLKEAQEENFLGEISRYEQTSSSSGLLTKKQRRISIGSNRCRFFMRSYGLYIRSFLSFNHSWYELSALHLSFVCQCFKLLRVLDLSSIEVHIFPAEITELLHLRYLALCAKEHVMLSPSVPNLWNLETFIVDGRPNGLLVFDATIWKMVKLRHLYTKRLIEMPYEPNSYCSFALNNLQTMGKLDLRGLDVRVLQLIPNLRRLRCSFMESWGKCDVFPRLKFLVHLQNLNVTYNGFNVHGRFPHRNEFPPNLKSLTLSNFGLPWEEMSTLGRLPNLEVLKLSYKAFKGPRWDTSDGGFGKLKFLKLRGLDIKQWNASSGHFPSLQTLVLDDCKLLEEIPSGLGDIFTLETIQIQYCGASATKSAQQIEEEQLRKGNDGLKVSIHRYHYEADEYDDEDDAP